MVHSTKVGILAAWAYIQLNAIETSCRLLKQSLVYFVSQ